MSDPLEKAFDEFADAVEKRVTGLIEEVKGLRTQLETRSAQIVEGPPGKDGIATYEELEAAIEKRVVEINVRTFADIYKGVYKPGTDYQRSALVTWGGSLFLALANTSNKPEQSPDWRLIVKHGADAKR